MDPTPSRDFRRWPVAMALAAAAVLALGTIRWYQERPRSPVPAAAFDLDTAMNLIGQQVPPDVESFYFFVLEPKAPTEAPELAAKMMQAAGEHDFIGITGADAGHNRAVLLAALAVPRNKDLRGLIVIYAGPPEQETELREVLLRNGAELRFVEYTPAAKETI